MATIFTSNSEESVVLPGRHWWLSLYPRLSAKGKRVVMVACLGATMLVQSGGVLGSPARLESSYTNPAGQNALRQLELSMSVDPIGDQFQVNTFTINRQVSPAVAMDSGGDFVVVWTSKYSDDDNYYSIQAQRYNAAGLPQGNQFRVNSYTSDRQEGPAVVMDSDGDFVVVWNSRGSAGSDSDDFSVQGQRYNAAGVPQGGQFQVNSYTTNRQGFPAIAMDSSGDFTVLWQSYGSDGSDSYYESIQGQRFNAAGVPQGGQFQVNSYTTNRQRYPSIALDEGGNFVAVWESIGSSGGDGDYSIQGQRFHTDGVPEGSQFQVNNYSTGRQRYPVVALDSDGDFVVAWQDGLSPYAEHSVQARRYNAAGVPQDDQFQVNIYTYTTGFQPGPDIAMDSDGNFVIVWDSNGSPGGDNSTNSIQGQSYDAGGTPLGDQFQVNSYTTNKQFGAAVAMDSDGDFTVAWMSYGSYSDDSDLSIQGQRFTDGAAQQFQVNSYTSDLQATPDVAIDGDGDFVVVWTSIGSNDGDISEGSIQGQRYNAAGVPQGNQFQVNSYTTDHQGAAAIAMDATGNFVVVWHSDGSSGSDTDLTSIQGQRYNAAGAPQGSQFQINSYTTSSQFSPTVAMDSDGDFVVTWWGTYGYSDILQGQRYDSLGVAQGGEFQINSYTTGLQTSPNVAMDSDGDFVVVWDSEGSGEDDTSSWSVQGQRYDAAGAPQGGQFQINSYTTSVQRYPAVSMDSEGDFVVVWWSYGSSGGDTDQHSIQGQRYNSAGVAQGSQFQVNSYTTNVQNPPAVSLDSDGNFVVVWDSLGSGEDDGSGYSIQGQRYNASGEAQGNQLQVNSYTSSNQKRPAVALDDNGDFLVVWQSYGSSGDDTSSYSIQGRRLGMDVSTLRFVYLPAVVHNAPAQ
jgi:hypothetical protein